MFDGCSVGYQQTSGAGPPYQAGEVFPDTKSILLLLRFYLGHKQDDLPAAGGEIVQNQDLRKDATLQGSGDGKISSKISGLRYCNKTRCSHVSRKVQRYPKDGVGSLQGQEDLQQACQLDNMGQERHYMVGRLKRVQHVHEECPLSGSQRD